MQIGKIIRPLWSTRKSAGLEGVRLLEAEIMPWGSGDLGGSGRRVVVADNLGAGIGEYVFLTFGSAVRDVVFGPEAPFKLVVTAIVDTVHLDSDTIGSSESFLLPRRRL